ncbi:MAG: Trm112 family protein [Sphingomonadaceae bacterium]|nr:Trm112 family protein [Sphingomonadaceae bacterium]
MSDDASVSAGSLDPALLAVLVCPLTRGPLRYDPQAEELISDAAQLAYPVRDGVPVMLVEEARFIG